MLATKGIEAVHWTAVGDPRAPDDELLRYAREYGYVVFTHDLDFGAGADDDGAKTLAADPRAGCAVDLGAGRGMGGSGLGGRTVRVTADPGGGSDR